MKTLNLSFVCSVFLSLVLLLSLFGCNKDEIPIVKDQATDTEILSKTATDTEILSKKGKPDKIYVCHYSADDDQWNLINVNENSWADHVLHGDVRLDDQDGDGFVPNNECGFGSMGDCDDKDSEVYPGATEICGNGIDDDCDGLIDSDDDDCCESPSPNELIGQWFGPYSPNPNLNVSMIIEDCSATVDLTECGAWSMDFLSANGGSYGVFLTPTGNCRTNPNWTLALNGTTLTITNANNTLWAILEKQ